MATTYISDKLRELLQSSFDLVQWYDFLQHFFNATELKENPERIVENTPDEGFFLGSIDTTDSYRIGLFCYKIAKGSVANKRVGLRNLVKSFINPTWGEFEAALVVFDSGDHWRLSFICDIKGEATLPKRYTYVFGTDDLLYKTPIERFSLLKKKGVSFENLKEAFSVEALSKEFFDKYRQYYADFVEYITGKRYVKKSKGWVEEQIHEPHVLLQTQFLGDEKRIRDYIKKLLGRIVFLHYLQRKGWLGVPAGKAWGEGDLDFMRHLFEYAGEEQKANFVETVLEPLFYGALNTDRSDNGDLFNTQVQFPNAGTSLRIPYLNGGLFEEDENDKLTVQFPAEYFKNLLDFFSQYNFTIDENDPSDAQVGVDPEMLGRIFESLLEDNKEKGAYYTPKEIVQYMCRESLTAYLRTDIDPEKEKEVFEAIAHFVKSNNAEDLLGKTERGKEYDLRAKVLDKLTEVKICDPAIGSGAFPMGLLRELYHCRIALEEQSVTPAEIKSQIIKNNIYGVDIERGAVDIARLRFWLSLVVDEDMPQPLPNLDYKIMQGNSLLESYQGVDLGTLTQRKEVKQGEIIIGELFEDNIDVYRKELRQAVSRYYSETDHTLKEKLHHKMNDVIKSLFAEQGYQIDLSGVNLSANPHFFLWHTWFDEVFNRPSGRNGFDIVIGNPPWGAKLSSEEKAKYKQLYQSAKTIKGVQKGSLDTYSLFIELGYTLLIQDGVLSMITPISITSSDALSGLHHILLHNCEDIYISSYAVRPQPVFENAVANTSIVSFRKTLSPAKRVYVTKMHRKIKGINLQQLIDNLSFMEVRDHILYGRIPKVSTDIELSILRKLSQHIKIERLIQKEGTPIIYRFAGGRYFKVVTPYSNGSSAERILYFCDDYAYPLGAILSSNLAFWFYQIYSDNLNWKSYELSEFKVPHLSEEVCRNLTDLYSEYIEDIERNANIRKTSAVSSYTIDSFKEYKIGRSKRLIDQIDDYICPLYGLSPEETEFIKNYEIEFRLGEED